MQPDDVIGATRDGANEIAVRVYCPGCDYATTIRGPLHGDAEGSCPCGETIHVPWDTIRPHIRAEAPHKTPEAPIRTNTPIRNELGERIA